MKRTLAALLLCLTIQPPRAATIWTLWCTEPGAAEETPRKGQWDTSSECHQSIQNALSEMNASCHDTKQGPRLGDKHEKVEAWAGFPTCAALTKFYRTCICKPGTLPEAVQ
jgi:hypothetical protein